MRTKKIIIAGMTMLVVLAVFSLFVGKYPLSMRELLAGNELHWRVFLTLRVSRTVVGVLGGFALGIAGFVFQTVFRNPLASPDIIGVSSGASAGAAAGILFGAGLGITTGWLGFSWVTAFAFAGALLSVILAMALSMIDRNGRNSTIVLAGIAVHSLAQTVLMCLKLTADPEKELASIEYWIMGSLNGINSHSILGNMILCMICVGAVFLLHRQIILLSMEEGEARMLGVNAGKLRLLLLLLATLMVSCVVSLSGLISFVGLVTPHLARMLTKNSRASTMFLGGIFGGCLLTFSDILARSVAKTELPVSIFTGIIGAPFLIYLIVRGRQKI
ncbi:MAG: iron ABC transporter permease [Clostridiales bacterium]|nr:iron ABC transporter permease [Candidatus Blautia equi]